MSRGYGWKGPECRECGSTRHATKESSWTPDGERIRLRKCLDCGQRGTSVEVFVPPEVSSFNRLNDRMEQERERNYARTGKGVFRMPVTRFGVPDRLKVTISLHRSSRERRAR